jgi:hypothetical protein
VKRLFRRLYGESPRHLAVLLPSFAVCGYALVRLLRTDWPAVTAWVVGGALLHDLVLVPLYAGADRLLHAATTGRSDDTLLLNHVRAPAFLSLLALLVYWPLITQDAGGNYLRATGTSADVYGPRWALLTAVLFTASGLLLTLRMWRGRGRTGAAGG